MAEGTFRPPRIEGHPHNRPRRAEGHPHNFIPVFDGPTVCRLCGKHSLDWNGVNDCPTKDPKDMAS